MDQNKLRDISSKTSKALKIKASGHAIETAVLVTDIGRYYRNLIDRDLEPVGVTRSQWWTLINLYYHEGVNQMELAAILDIGKSSTGKLLSKLEDKGWIVRKQDREDGRANKIFLSDHIRPIVDKMADLGIEIVSGTLADFTEQEQKLLVEMLIRLRKGFVKGTPHQVASLDRLRSELVTEAKKRL
jgi:MarR family transcriptional regulator, transcriptional regulator for hemolysin